MTVVRRYVGSRNLVNEVALAHWGAVAPHKKKIRTHPCASGRVDWKDPCGDNPHLNLKLCYLCETVFGKFPPCHQSRSYKHILSNFSVREGLFLYTIVYTFSGHTIYGTSDNNLKFLYSFLYRDLACHKLILNKWVISIRLFFNP